ncbi:Uma2 family endonuclease [Planomonospora sp. ID91781]|uniref:Uma2 family endonuclease n=1 Tax=Planomonospora sp. ID91781 TaxID=2738135 RepID=UPI0018C39FD6|nr:Uma2 family endonuclease [Planomonospora sp. ID91781]MBG0819554.1 Uma2 family endonuclease [Planomonospora sp. ID91781]
MTAEVLPSWFYPPADGWVAEDLDRLPPEAPRRLELVDGALIVMSPQTKFHMRVIDRLGRHLEELLPPGCDVVREMTVTLGRRQRPEPDLMVVREQPDAGMRRTTYRPDEVVLAVEVVSPDSEERDRRVKPERYAEAGIRHYWRVENEDGRPVFHIYELDDTTRTYVPVSIEREHLRLTAPFSIDIPLKKIIS